MKINNQDAVSPLSGAVRENEARPPELARDSLSGSASTPFGQRENVGVRAYEPICQRFGASATAMTLLSETRIIGCGVEANGTGQWF